MTHIRWIFLVVTILIIAAYYQSQPRNAMECMRAGLDDVHTEAAAKQLAMYCGRKYQKEGK